MSSGSSSSGHSSSSSDGNPDPMSKGNEVVRRVATKAARGDNSKGKEKMDIDGKSNKSEYVRRGNTLQIFDSCGSPKKNSEPRLRVRKTTSFKRKQDGKSKVKTGVIVERHVEQDKEGKMRSSSKTLQITRSSSSGIGPRINWPVSQLNCLTHPTHNKIPPTQNMFLNTSSANSPNSLKKPSSSSNTPPSSMREMPWGGPIQSQGSMQGSDSGPNNQEVNQEVNGWAQPMQVPFADSSNNSGRGPITENPANLPNSDAEFGYYGYIS